MVQLKSGHICIAHGSHLLSLAPNLFPIVSQPVRVVLRDGYQISVEKLNKLLVQPSLLIEGTYEGES